MNSADRRPGDADIARPIASNATAVVALSSAPFQMLSPLTV
jgi:hypothetical protein